MLRISVRDHGPGMAEEDLERVFEPFVRLEPSRNRNSGGSGIGLAISRNIARWHGGDVKLRNAPGKTGLIAEISLPRVKTTAELVAKQRRGDAAGPVTATAARPAPVPATAPATAPAAARRRFQRLRPRKPWHPTRCCRDRSRTSASGATLDGATFSGADSRLQQLLDVVLKFFGRGLRRVALDDGAVARRRRNLVKFHLIASLPSRPGAADLRCLKSGMGVAAVDIDLCEHRKADAVVGLAEAGDVLAARRAPAGRTGCRENPSPRVPARGTSRAASAGPCTVA